MANTKAIEFDDELFGFYPDAQGSRAVFHYNAEHQTVTVATKYATDDSTDDSGWDWGLGSTRLNVSHMLALRNWLNDRIKEAGNE